MSTPLVIDLDDVNQVDRLIEKLNEHGNRPDQVTDALRELAAETPVLDGKWCSADECFMPASVLIQDRPFCTTDGRDANGGSL
jgi:hypothetical protein